MSTIYLALLIPHNYSVKNYEITTTRNIMDSWKYKNYFMNQFITPVTENIS